jgi:tRNA-splicing ligase RtcB
MIKINDKINLYGDIESPSVSDAIIQLTEFMKDSTVIESVALMPDCHKGYSVPIGTVFASRGAIFPSAVGYDIGCGMCAFKLGNFKDVVKENSKKIFDLIYEKIPVGFNTNKTTTDYSTDGLTEEGIRIAHKKNYRTRGVGHGIASHYMTVASSNTDELKEEFDNSSIAKKLLKFNPKHYNVAKEKYVQKKAGRLRPKEGHYSLDVNSKEGKNYIRDLNWCLDFALVNRKEMMARVVESILKFTHIDESFAKPMIKLLSQSLDSTLYNPELKNYISKTYNLEYTTFINRNHNHAELKDGLWIHRKGATHAEKGMMGVIPGNMRDGSFIVKGKGNPDSLYSSSHGAGRVLGRIQAKKTLNSEEFKNSMKGITAKVDDSTLDESPNAYKNIFEVMEQQKNLVDVVCHISPLINIKG